MADTPVPAAVDFRRSSFSGGGNCVEVAFHEDLVFVRNSRRPERAIAFTARSWSAFAGWLRQEDASGVNPGSPGSP